MTHSKTPGEKRDQLKTAPLHPHPIQSKLPLLPPFCAPLIVPDHVMFDFVLQRGTRRVGERVQLPASSATEDGGLLQRQPSQRNGRDPLCCI